MRRVHGRTKTLAALSAAATTIGWAMGINTVSTTWLINAVVVDMTGGAAGGGVDGSLGHSCWSCPTDRPPAPSGPAS